jgi:hypothetical protein
MGALTLPASGMVYADAQALIYTVEKHPTYGPLLCPLWQAVQAAASGALTGSRCRISRPAV